ncbi:GNAT family N-acetyltransferase [Nioella ostreopsis]|uniref:GNAT family N-acetyltransferase n=1 Tax=Nioella ostreopsis TaxID=2448479 RepID=UPI000FDAE606|nr:GNAT family N-acetyltransferase [Nioella ostreopsis]
MVTIIAAETPKHLQDFGVLAREFASWAMASFHKDTSAPPAVFAKLEQELSNLPGKYAAPEGALFIAYENGEAVGCVAGFKSESGAFEVTRLWVRSECRGMGVGDKLVDALLKSASQSGYKTSVLRSRSDMTFAHNVYRRAGFVDVDGNMLFSNFMDIEVAMQRDLT